jgi:hypothetical protein
MVRKRIASALVLAAVYATQAGHGSCSGDLLHDSGFDIWCGDQLCSWQVDKGTVRQAPTWHQGDLGVELVGDEVAISQRSEARDLACVRFDLVADIALDASVVLEMDVYDDGEVDFSERLPTAAWQQLSYRVVMPARSQGVRFRIRKRGGGRAVLAQIRAREESECDGTPLAQPAAPLGASCWGVEDDAIVTADDWCASGTCAPASPGAAITATCAGCGADGDCGDGQVCGLASRVARFLDPYRSCVASGSRGLGERCAGDGECRAGVCCAGVCSDCCPGDGRSCPDGAACQAVAVAGLVTPPAQCDPAGGTRASGAGCLRGEDCASGRCAGENPLRVCLVDGRLCEADADCPPDGSPEADDEPGTCAALGVARGTCD